MIVCVHAIVCVCACMFECVCVRESASCVWWGVVWKGCGVVFVAAVLCCVVVLYGRACGGVLCGRGLVWCLWQRWCVVWWLYGRACGVVWVVLLCGCGVGCVVVMCGRG